ncbi:MAG: ferrochelatase [Acidobacteriota bacterium]
MPEAPVDAVLMVGFGGPASAGEIMPFLREVAEDRRIPEERLREVEQHYLQVGGCSPYVQRTQDQKRALERWLQENGRKLPVYLGMRHGRPRLKDTLATLRDDARRHAVVVVLSSHRAEASWERYQRSVAKGIEAAGSGGLEVTYMDPWFDDPRFVEAHASRLEEVVDTADGEWPEALPVIFTAHSLPREMAGVASYVKELRASCHGVADLLEIPDWELAYQSRSGPPEAAWLEPDINDVLRRRAAAGDRRVVVQAIGFLVDHVEVLYDLDIQARRTAAEAGLTFLRAGCVNEHPQFITLLGERILQAAGRGS